MVTTSRALQAILEADPFLCQIDRKHVQLYEVGKVTKYDARRRAAQVRLLDTLRVGDCILVLGRRSNFGQPVTALYAGRDPVAKAWRGDLVWLEVVHPAETGDEVFVVLAAYAVNGNGNNFDENGAEDDGNGKDGEDGVEEENGDEDDEDDEDDVDDGGNEDENGGGNGDNDEDDDDDDEDDVDDGGNEDDDEDDDDGGGDGGGEPDQPHFPGGPDGVKKPKKKRPGLGG